MLPINYYDAKGEGCYKDCGALDNVNRFVQIKLNSRGIKEVKIV